MIQVNLLSDLYWFICVVEAGSFSAAAENTRVAKSSLSRRIMQLEQQLGVQLLNRTTRQFTLTTVGEQIYRNALEMLAAAEAASLNAQETLGTPRGLLRMSAPSALTSWLLGQQSAFHQQYPRVRFSLLQADALVELRPQRLDLSLSLNASPKDSSEIVARPLAKLTNVIVGHPALLKRLGNPKTLAQVDDSALLAIGPAATPQPWSLEHTQRELHNPVLCAEHLLTLREAAKAGLGLACLPLYACQDELTAGSLLQACPQDRPSDTTLYALTPSHRGITQTTRSFLQHLREQLAENPPPGMEPIQTLASLSPET